MKRQEYKLLVENWNNYLLLEEKVCILEEKLINEKLINENLLKRLRNTDIKRSVIIPILLRLEYHQIKIPNNKASKPLFSYIERMQELPSVKDSFTSLEIELL